MSLKKWLRFLVGREKVKTEKLTWDEVFKRKGDFVGGEFIEIEDIDSGYHYRGLIKAIKRLRNGSYCIVLHWSARLPDTGEWEVGGNNRIVVCDRDTPPSEIGNGFAFHCLLGPGIILPKGGRKLNPSKVKGLNLAST